MNTDLDARLDRLAGLGEPVRRALYRFVVAQREPVSREQAATGVGVPHHVAKFNLDRLVADGLIEADYRRPEGRGGPGAGRPAKMYRRSKAELEVSLPERRYDLAGRVLAHAVARAEQTGKPIGEVLHAVASEAGEDLSRAVVASGRRPSQRVATNTVMEALGQHGFEPREANHVITLANCPFHALAAQETEVVCGMNLAFIEGVIAGVKATSLTARLDPAPDRCCVRIVRS